MSVHYGCGNCSAKVQATDAFCRKCGRNLIEVGRAMKLELVETISLSDNVGLSKTISTSLANVSGDISVASGLVNAIPMEKRNEIGFDEEVLVAIEEIGAMLARQQQLWTNVAGSPINVPITVSKEGNNIVVTTCIDEGFKRFYQEVDKMDLEDQTKRMARLVAEELKQEIEKEKPDVGKVRRMYYEVKSLVPFSLAVIQLGSMIGKYLVGSS